MTRRKSAARRIAARAGAASLLVAAGWIGYSAMSVPHAMELAHALGGERKEFTGRAGRLSYYVAGQGEPTLLVHSVNAAGSAYEVKPVYEHLRGSRHVYAVDLPGFGFSERSDRRYDIRLFVDAVHDMLDMIAREHGERQVDALALSLAGEFVARACMERQQPRRLRSLALVTPTGFSRGAGALRGSAAESREIPGMYRVFTFPLWSQAFYDLLVSRASIRYFLQRTYGSKRIDEGMLEYDYLTTHQPGARHAPYAFVSGRLFSKDIRSVYEKLDLPIWVPHATRGDFRDFSEADWARARDNWTFQPFDSGALPHFEQTEAFLDAYERFLASSG